MDTKFLWSGGCASVCVALLIAQLNAGELTKPTINAIDIEQLTRASTDLLTSADHELLAFGAIVPMPLTQGSPTADIVEIVSRSAAQSALHSEATSLPATHSQDLAAKSTSVVPAVKAQADRRPELPFTFQSSISKPMPASRHHELLDFKSQLAPTGFSPPYWQEMEIQHYFLSGKQTAKRFVVVLDPGHGGSDPGSKGHNGLIEKDLTLDIARRVRLFLTEFKHIDVRLTRNHDYGLSRQSRVSAIKRSEADMVISLHFNHLPQSDVNLVESYYAGPENIRDSMSSSGNAQLHRTASAPNTSEFKFTGDSRNLANTLHQRVFAEVSLDNEQVQNAGVKQETLFVLTRSFTPGVLLEISCLSHPAEADKLATDEYRNRLAAALADGIRHHHDALQKEPTVGKEEVGA